MTRPIKILIVGTLIWSGLTMIALIPGGIQRNHGSVIGLVLGSWSAIVTAVNLCTSLAREQFGQKKIAAALLMLAALLLASTASAAPIIVWRAGAIEDAPVGVHTFRIATSANAYIDHTTGPGNVKEWTAGDNSHVAALFADLTNGVNNPVTISTSLFSHTVDENFFLGALMTSPFTAFGSYPEITASLVDLHGFVYDNIRIETISQGNGQTNYTLEATVHAPEPASVALFVLGIGLVHATARVPNSRRRSTAH